MPWVKVPAEHHPIFEAALPKDPRVETMKMFGGIAAKTNGHVFAGLFGRSTMIWLPESERAEALALKGAAPFDPMGDGRARSDKVMLPESMMKNPAKLRSWIARAFEGAVALPPKEKKSAARAGAQGKAGPRSGAKSKVAAPTGTKSKAAKRGRATGKATPRARAK